MEDFYKFIGAVVTILIGIATVRSFSKSNGISPEQLADIIAAIQAKKAHDSPSEQPQQIDDTTKKAVGEAVTDLITQKPEGFDEALACLEDGDTQKAEDIFQTILEAKEAEGQASLVEAAQAAKHIGALAFLHDTEKARNAYKKATQLTPDDADSWNELGHLLRRIGDLQGAERAYGKVLALGNSIADKKTIAAATGNLGIIARTRGDLDQAEDYHQQALAINKELGRKEGMASQLGNLGLIAKIRGDLDQAEDYHQQALAINKELGRKEGMANDLGNLGLIARRQGDLDKAEDYHQRSLAIEKELGRKEGMANQLGNLGNVAKQRENMPEARRLWREALALFEEIGMKPQIELVQGWLDEAERE